MNIEHGFGGKTGELREGEEKGPRKSWWSTDSIYRDVQGEQGRGQGRGGREGGKHEKGGT